MVIFRVKMNTNFLLRRLFVNDPLIKKFSRTPRFSYSKSSNDGDGKKDDSISTGSEIDSKDIRKALSDLNYEKDENTVGEDKPDVDLESAEVKKSGFLKAFEKFSNLEVEEPETKKKPPSGVKRKNLMEKFSKLDSDGNKRQSKKSSEGGRSSFAEQFSKLDFDDDMKSESKRDLFDEDDPSEQPREVKGFAKSFKKFSELDSLLEEEPDVDSESDSDSEKQQQTFAYLLRNSKFIDLGDPEGKVVIGKIYHIVGNDLYIDFGWKFHTVCQRPPKGGEKYIRGTRVRLLIKDLELSTRFLGSTTDTTLREADCVLLGLAVK